MNFSLGYRVLAIWWRISMARRMGTEYLRIVLLPANHLFTNTVNIVNKQSLIKVLITVLVVSGLAFTGFDGLSTRTSRQEARNHITSIFESLSIGMSQEEVETLALKYSDLKVSRDSRYLTVSSSPELGAKNWILTTQYDSKKRLAFGRIHTADSFSETPLNAPEDIGTDLSRGENN